MDRSSTGDVIGTQDDWIDAVCQIGTFFDGTGGLPGATGTGVCRGRSGGGLVQIGQFDSDYKMRNALAQTLVPYYVSGVEPDGTVVVFAVPGATNAESLGSSVLDPLTRFGFTINRVSPSSSVPVFTAPPVQPTTPDYAPPPVTVMPSAPALPPGTDTQGFVTYPGARCNSTNSAVLMAQTAQSVIVICQTGVGRYYYRGYGLQNGLSLEIDDPVRTGTGFVATNNGVRYAISPSALTIARGGETLSTEPMEEYWLQ